jgi:surface protein
MSIATALQAKIDEKEAIRLAIETKGVTVDPSVLLSGYPTKIDEISTGGDGYQRPSDWLEIDSLVVDLDEKFVGLYAIYEDSNFISLSATGNYTVDWGDGIVENYTSGVQCYHQYDYADFVGTESTRGYRQAIVTVTPNGGTLTNIDLQKKHNQSGLPSYTLGWLDIKMSGANISSMTIGESIYKLALLEQFSFIGSNLVTNMYNMFYNCYALQSIPLLDTSAVTSMSQMFYNCYALQTIPLLDTSSVTNMHQMFSNCYALQTIPLLDTQAVNNMTQMFYTCTALQTIPLLDTSAVTSMSQMFLYCYALQTIPLLDTSSVTNMHQMFYYCYTLQSIPLLDTSKVTSMYNMFGNCYALSKGTLSGTKATISYINCKLSQLALVDIFNGLVTVAGPTITITGNWGASSLTVGERAIATDKGWTIVG